MTLNAPSHFRHFLLSQPDFEAPSSSSSPLPALYADLASHRSSNRTSYDASVDWWTRLLSRACLAGAQWTINPSSTVTGKGKLAERGSTSDRLVMHLNEQLIEECTIDKVGRPLGLGTVMMELQRSGRVFPLKKYLSSDNAIAGPSTSRRAIRSIMYSVATTPLTWAFSQMSMQLGFGDDGSDDDASERDWRIYKGDWVSWDNLQTLSDAIISVHRNRPRLSPLESLYSLATFQAELVEPALKRFNAEKGDQDTESSHLSSLDLQVLIKYMSRDRQVVVSDGGIVKMQHIEGESLGFITEEEKSIVTVKETYSCLEKQIEEIEKRIKERQAKLETCLREKKREQALSYLRSRKMLDELLEKRIKSMETLHGVLLKIEQAASDVEIVKAYELSTSSLQALLSDARLQPDRIDASMEKMQDTLADAEEVRRAIEVGNEGIRRVQGEEEINDEEMEAELKRLEEEKKEEEREKRKAEEKEKEKIEMARRRKEEQKKKEKEEGGNEEIKQINDSKNTFERQEAEAIAS